MFGTEVIGQSGGHRRSYIVGVIGYRGDRSHIVGVIGHRLRRRLALFGTKVIG